MPRDEILKHVGKEALTGIDGTHVTPYICVLPMGFSWAFFLAQEALRCSVRRVLPSIKFIEDLAPMLDLQEGAPAALIYADNGVHVGSDKKRVGETAACVSQYLGSLGLETHEKTEASVFAESLGVRFDGESLKVRGTRDRLARVSQGLIPLMRVRPTSGQELEHIIGHILTLMLLCRLSICWVTHSYTFIRAHYFGRRTLAVGTRVLRAIRGILPLCKSDIFNQPLPFVLCTDASGSGYAVARCYADVSEVREVLKFHGRWRYKIERIRAVPARARGLANRDKLLDVYSVRSELRGELMGEVFEDPAFPEVPSGLLAPERWRLLWKAPLVHQDAIHCKELWAVVAAVRNASRQVTHHGKELFVLGDSMCCSLVISKGRSSTYHFNTLLLRLGALCLATGLRLRVRWIPCELNVADPGSRAWEQDNKNVPHALRHLIGPHRRSDGAAAARDSAASCEWGSCTWALGWSRHGQAQRLCGATRSRCRSRRRTRSWRRADYVRDMMRTRAWRLDKKSSRLAHQRRMAMMVHETRSQGMTLGQGVLGDMSVSKNTLQDYLMRLRDFWDYLETHEMDCDLEVPASADAALTRYANHLPREGEMPSEGDKVRAAFEAVHPRFARNGDQGLPMLRRALRGWHKWAPSQRRAKLPTVVLAAITMEFIGQQDLGKRETALALQTGFSAYLRPAELCRLAITDLVPPGDATLHWGLMLAPFERGVSTKTGKFDESILLDDVTVPWLGKALQRHCKNRLGELKELGHTYQSAKKQSMWRLGQMEHLDHLRWAAAHLGCLHLADSLYALRHGASRDALEKKRDLVEVQRRGRWAHISSVRHYEGHGRIQNSLNQLPLPTLRQWREGLRTMRRHFLKA